MSANYFQTFSLGFDFRRLGAGGWRVSGGRADFFVSSGVIVLLHLRRHRGTHRRQHHRILHREHRREVRIHAGARVHTGGATALAKLLLVLMLALAPFVPFVPLP